MCLRDPKLILTPVLYRNNGELRSFPGSKLLFGAKLKKKKKKKKMDFVFFLSQEGTPGLTR